MEEYGLGPNGAMLYCIEYLEANFDWLVEELDNLLGEGGDGYVIFDTPGQVELWTNHDSLKNVVEKLQKMDYRVGHISRYQRRRELTSSLLLYTCRTHTTLSTHRNSSRSSYSPCAQ
jgi:GTPase SAR1 family protein